MLRAVNFIARSLIVVGLLTSGQVFGATRLEPLTVGYSNITATYAPLWIAVEERVGVKDQVLADEAILEESYQHTRAIIEDAPHPSLQVVKGGLEMFAAISAGQANRCESDYRAGVYEADRRERLCSGAL